MNDLLLTLDLQFFAGDAPTDAPTEPQGDAPTQTEMQEPQQGSDAPTAAALTLDAVQAFLNEHDDGKKFLQSFADSRVTDAIKTYEQKTLPKKVQEELNKKFPPESEAEKQLRDLRAEFEAAQAQAAQEKLMNAALKNAPNFGVPNDIIDLFVRDNEEITTSNMERFKTHFEAAVDARVQAEIAKRFGEAADKPAAPNQPTTQYTIADLRNMTSAQIQALGREKVDAILAAGK